MGQLERLERTGEFLASAPAATDKDVWRDRQRAALDTSREMISEMSGKNSLLRNLLSGASQEISEAIAQEMADAGTESGRRLLQRETLDLSMASALSRHPLMAAVGSHGLRGVTELSCEALCEAVASDATNATDPRSCQAFAFKRGDPYSYTDITGTCWLLTNSGSCSAQDFAVMIYTRHVASEAVCKEARPGPRSTVCLGLPAGRPDTAVLSAGDAMAMAARLPANPSDGAGGLPIPRSALEAMSMVAFARQQGVNAFWGGRPDTSASAVKMHWITPDGTELELAKEEKRCVLVASGPGREDRMYAHLRPCNALLADGLLSVAAAAAPPPPPGGSARGYFDPEVAPPPPPTVVESAWYVWKRREIVPRTTAICSPGVEGREHQKLCLEMIERLGRWQPVAGVGFRAPLCSANVCWRACEASHASADDESFHTCPSLSCAVESCHDFLERSCPPVTHGAQGVRGGVRAGAAVAAPPARRSADGKPAASAADPRRRTPRCLEPCATATGARVRPRLRGGEPGDVPGVRPHLRRRQPWLPLDREALVPAVRGPPRRALVLPGLPVWQQGGRAVHVPPAGRGGAGAEVHAPPLQPRGVSLLPVRERGAASALGAVSAAPRTPSTRSGSSSAPTSSARRPRAGASPF